MKKIFASLLMAILCVLGFAGCATEAPPEWQGGNGDGSIPPVTNAQGMVKINGGTFSMGSPDSEEWRGDDEKRHTVTVSDFYISPYEVTQAEYTAITGNNPSHFKGDNLPVENISWYDALRYCNARSEAENLTPVYTIDGENVTWNREADGYRLPTEAEWEFACRAGTYTPFNTEKVPGADICNFYGHYPYGIEDNYFDQDNLETKPGLYRQTTVAVNSFSPNKWGLYNMHGNVGEWCWDYYGEYPTEEQTDPTGAGTGTLRVNRGGGWNDFGKHTRSAYRASMAATSVSFAVGLRLVRNGSAVVGNVVTGGGIHAQTGGKILIVYFSWGGNTRGVAREIQRQTGAFSVELEVVGDPYDIGYNEVLELAQKEQKAQARPKLKDETKNLIGDISEYDTIILGYPNWWASIPMPIASFLEDYDLTGKTIMPFCSHGGGRFGQSLTAIAKLAPDSPMTDGLSVHYSGGSSLPSDVSAWLTRNGVIG